MFILESSRNFSLTEDVFCSSINFLIPIGTFRMECNYLNDFDNKLYNQSVMIYDAILEVSYKNGEGLTNITNVFSDVKVSLWCNWSIDIIVLDTENISQKNELLQKLPEYIGENMILAPSNDSSPVIVRPCSCPSTPVTVVLPDYDGFHLSPIKYDHNKEILHVMLSSESSEKLFDRIKTIKNVEEINLKYLKPYKFPEKPFPLYVPVNEILQSLTDKQYQILLEAYNKGYYELPRQATTELLSQNFNISRRAFEDHLRKAERNIFNTILPYFLMTKMEKL